MHAFSKNSTFERPFFLHSACNFNTIQEALDNVEYGDELTYEFENDLLKTDKFTFNVQYFDGNKVLVIPANVNRYDVVVDELSYKYLEGTNPNNYEIKVDAKGYFIDIVPRKVEVNLYQLEDSGREYGKVGVRECGGDKWRTGGFFWVARSV